MIDELLEILRLGSSYKDRKARHGMYVLAVVLLLVGIILLV